MTTRRSRSSSKSTETVSSAELEKLLNKIKKAEKGHKLDLSSDEDLSIGIMNLISIEEHFFFTYNKTGKNKYLDLLDEVRQMRKDLLKRIIKDYEGEVWCISKHLLAASMRMMEVGTKALTKGNQQDAGDFFKKGYQLYSLFWGLNLGVVKTDKLKQRSSDELEYLSEDKTPAVKAKASFFEKMGELVKKAVDCCKE
ncbi:MAG TPA: hypothetical protein PLM16_00990 [Candidatus Woesebacteria bacterium]|nr:hypothetical protein [Candidatus Woesebacteria bacterium]